MHITVKQFKAKIDIICAWWSKIKNCGKIKPNTLSSTLKNSPTEMEHYFQKYECYASSAIAHPSELMK